MPAGFKMKLNVLSMNFGMHRHPGFTDSYSFKAVKESISHFLSCLLLD